MQRLIAVDSAGNAYVTGETYSTNFPMQNALQPGFGGGNDAFVAKISDTGPPPPQPTLTVIPTFLDFNALTVGSVKDLIFTVQNSGGGTLTGNAERFH